MPDKAQHVGGQGVAPSGAPLRPQASSHQPSFVHLHLHSEYSLLDGGNRLDKLCARVKELGMDAVAVTDHGNLHGAVAFYEQARKVGIKPILGVEAYVAPGDRRDRTHTGVADGGYHLVLLAENQVGWSNLLYLCSEAYRTGFYYKPRMDREILAAHADGLIAINGHLGSELAHHLVEFHRNKSGHHWDAAVACAQWHRDVFTPNERGEPRFYIELQHHVREQNEINPHLIRLAKELDLPLVCDNDSHFLRAEDHDAHDTLICISMGKFKAEPDRLHYPEEIYVKSPQEMRDLFEREYAEGGIGKEACDNTLRIAERCNVELDFSRSHAPVVAVKAPAKKSLPKHDDPKYAGDLTGWFKDYCASFELEPATDPALKQSELKEQCDQALRLLAEAGMVWRYGEKAAKQQTSKAANEAGNAANDDPEMAAKWTRLDRELTILADKNISAYFLIVWDFVNWGRQKGIPALARGSGVGTMVGYVLGLSNACPVRYGLLFERFTDPDRSEYPDIDIDLCQDGRGDVLDYVRRKYGHVAQIITFGTLKARAVIRDVGRVHQIPLPEVDKIAKLVPESLGMTLGKALEEEPELKKLYDTRDEIRTLIDTGRVLEGQARHASVHAAGVIVATRPLDQLVPLYKQSGAGENEIVTQWDGPTCEKIGLLKMDFLGLRTLSIIEKCKAIIRETLSEEEIWKAVGGSALRADADGDGREEVGSESRPTHRSTHPLDLDRLTFDDPRVFEMFTRGDTTGVFQFESGGMRRLLQEMKPDRLEDLIAANALFRPGPMDLIPDYNRRKHGQDRVPQVHPIVDHYTAETYGVMVYQEQVMQIVHGLGGIPLREAYGLIKAISKKKEKVINAAKPKFIEGAQTQGLSKDAATELFELILKFAGYGFNKSHSTGYAIVAYQTAYLKTYFPNQYMAAFLSYESQAQKVSDWAPYLEDCRRTRFLNGKIGVEVRPPDVNLSAAAFTVVFDDAAGEPHDALHGHVRFGLRAIKGAGEKAIEAIIAERERHEATKARRHEAGEPSALAAGDPSSVPPCLRASVPFTSLYDFCERVPTGAVNKATIEALIKAGAFDSLHGRENRAAMTATIEAAVSAGQTIAQDKASGQNQLFGFGGGPKTASPEPAPEPTLVRAEPWTEAEMLANEKETLGFYVSSHPLEKWRDWSTIFITATTTSIKEARQDQRIVLAGLVQSVRTIVVRSGRSAGQKMAIVTFEDIAGTCETVLFTDCYNKFAHLVEQDAMIFTLGRIDLSRGDPQVIVERIVPIDGVPLQPGRLCLRVNGPALNGSGKSAVTRAAELLGSRGNPDSAAAGADAFPVDLVVDTEHGRAVLQTPVRTTLSPDLIAPLTAALGPGCIRITRGVWLDADERRKDNRSRRPIAT